MSNLALMCIKRNKCRIYLTVLGDMKKGVSAVMASL